MYIHISLFSMNLEMNIHVMGVFISCACTLVQIYREWYILHNGTSPSTFSNLLLNVERQQFWPLDRMHIFNIHRIFENYAYPYFTFIYTYVYYLRLYFPPPLCDNSKDSAAATVCSENVVVTYSPVQKQILTPKKTKSHKISVPLPISLHEIFSACHLLT